MDKDRIDQIIDKHQCEASALIQILLDVQSENHWLPKEALERIGQRLNVPLTRVQHIATFYKAFSVVPKGRHSVHICMGTACHVRGGDIILENFERKLGIREGDTTEDREFSVERVACVGCCALAPVALVGEAVHGKMAPSKIEGLFTRIEIEKEMAERQKKKNESDTAPES